MNTTAELRGTASTHSEVQVKYPKALIALVYFIFPSSQIECQDFKARELINGAHFVEGFFDMAISNCKTILHSLMIALH